MATPYREIAKVEPSCQHTKRCCGVCHCAVGGCLLGVEFEVPGGLFGIGKRRVGAGASMDRPTGTGAMCWCATHQKWERCDDGNHGRFAPGVWRPDDPDSAP